MGIQTRLTRVCQVPLSSTKYIANQEVRPIGEGAAVGKAYTTLVDSDELLDCEKVWPRIFSI